MQAVKKFISSESGASAVEYGLLVGLIAAVLVTSVTNIGTKVKAKFDALVTALT